jgi:hypothetical protein
MTKTFQKYLRVQKLGHDLQLMTPVSTPIAWLFAQPLKGAENGFALTGGVFNYSADLRFTETGHSAQVKYVFKV